MWGVILNRTLRQLPTKPHPRLHPSFKMATFFGDLYSKLFPTRTSQTSAHSPPTFIITDYNMTSPSPSNDAYLPLMSASESAVDESPAPAGGEPGYFPTSPRSSMSSTISAQSDLINSVTAAAKSAVAKPETIPSRPQIVKVDTMSRTFPKPTEEVSLEELLARKPHKWALGHWVENARPVRVPVVDKETMAKEFEKEKMELLRAKEELQKLAARS